MEEQQVSDKLIIANKFNLLFTNIGQDLVKKIRNPGNKKCQDYLQFKQDVQFSVQKVNQNDIEIMINRLHQKSSCGKDGLSTKLLRQLKTPLLEPLETIINIIN